MGSNTTIMEHISPVAEALVIAAVIIAAASLIALVIWGVKKLLK